MRRDTPLYLISALLVAGLVALILADRSQPLSDDGDSSRSTREGAASEGTNASAQSDVSTDASRSASEGPPGDAAGPGEVDVAAAQTASADGRALVWEQKYRGMSADQLDAELYRIQMHYTDEMTALTWPMLQSGEVLWSDGSRNQPIPQSKVGALVAQFSPRGGQTPYIVVTEEQAPQIHDLMREIEWLMGAIEKQRKGQSGTKDG